jgi:isopenicillin N synthase-like dioxygenase
MLSSAICRFAFGNLKVPVIDVGKYLRGSAGWEEDCQEVASTLRTFGLVIIRDPRVNQQENDRFLDLMERYFAKRSQQYREGSNRIDFSPESNYQVGIMHEYQEKFQSYQEEKLRLQPPNHSLTPV